MTALVVGVPLTAHRWRHELNAYVTDHVPGVDLRALPDSRDVLSSASELDVVVVDDTADFLTADELRSLSQQGVRIFGLFHRGKREGRGQDWLTELGIPAQDTFDVDTEPPALLDALTTVDEISQRRRRINGAGRAPAIRRPYVPVAPRRTSPERRGLVIAVGGGSDSPGRTEIACGLAHRLAGRRPTVLVDLDDKNPSLASRLGFHVTPGVLDALAAVRAGADLQECLATRRPVGHRRVAPRADVIVGLANPGERDQLGEVFSLLDALITRWPYVVADTGPTSETDPPNGVARVALQSADVVLAVCRGTPQGVIRLLSWAADAAPLVGSITVVVNHAPKDRYQRRELYDLLVRNIPPRILGPVVWIDHDLALNSAVWRADLTGWGRFAKGIEGLADLLAPQRPMPLRAKFRRAWAGGPR